jgi:hypothetical protein
MIGIIIGIIGISIVGIILSVSMNNEKINELQKSIPIETQEKSPIMDTTQKSGPFYINKSEYMLGEKIFFRAVELGNNEKGEIWFLRPINNTHSTPYQVIPFDGKLKFNFNQYLEPKLLKHKNTCNIENMIGVWEIWFKGTNYKSLKFEILNEILVGEEKRFEPIC